MKKMTIVTNVMVLMLQIFSVQLFAAQPIGYASMNVLDQNGTNGGEGGPVVTVSNTSDLLENIKKQGPRIILVSGMIKCSGMHPVSSDKTIAGIGSDAGITNGGFHLDSVHNVIIQNLNFHRGNDDNINVQMYSHHVWIHHNKFMSTADGAVDIKHGASYITVSYNHFIGIYKLGLIGHNDVNADQDVGRLRITYHHNYFQNCRSRQPRVRYGEVHIFNNYYQNIGNYGIGVGILSRIYSENNHKEGGSKFCQIMTNGGSGAIKDIGSIGGSSIRPELVTWNPKDRYEYTADPATEVKSKVTANAGIGKIKFETALISPAQVSKKNRNPFLQLPSGKVFTYNIRGQRIPELKEYHSPGIYLSGYKSDLKPYIHRP
jgi:pectate lyase